MDHQVGGGTGTARFAASVERLAEVIGHADRAAPLKAYCTGLILPGERKSIEPIAARVEPGRVQAAHQCLHHFVAKTDWSDEALLAVVRTEVLPAIEQPEGEQEPTKYWLSSLAPDTALADLVERAKLRWRLERDYQELKQEIGLGHYEGRGWRGFHHHATLCIAAYGFLVSERGRIPPSGAETPIFSPSCLPDGYRPRGTPSQTGAPR
jgi:SRSO17 transposase